MFATLSEIGKQLSQYWYDYWRSLRRNKSEIEQWHSIDDTMILAGEWLREALGYDEVVTDNDGNQYIIASYPFYKTLLLSGALEKAGRLTEEIVKLVGAKSADGSSLAGRSVVPERAGLESPQRTGVL